ncbi:SDR family oxidoreductase [Streptomyces sp. NPDC000348]|uniref:SDR family oxidoreductase n=1 Tax=Streptomyces sp. NPDC000348 TaxID=3364538 RepID=UPI00368789FA
MRVFVTGASGWIGSPVLRELLAAGHQVVGLVRSDSSARAVAAAGGEPVLGDVADLDAVAALARGVDGVIHLAFDHDFSRFEQSVKEEGEILGALGAALAGSGKPLVVASGTPAEPGVLATERSDSAGDGPAAVRVANARAVLDLARHGVRSCVVRLPRSVHGEGDAGFIAQLVAIARRDGVSGYVGDGSQRWPAVHVLDAARLFRAGLEDAPAGSVLHAVGDEGVPILAVAQVIGRHLGLPSASLPAESLGFLGGLLAVDQPASSAYTQDLLGWFPREPGLLADLEAGHYFR